MTFEQLVFPDIEQEILVFIGEKGGEEKGIKIIELNNLDDLKNLALNSNDFQKMKHVKEKWYLSIFRKKLYRGNEKSNPCIYQFI